jgi:predicted AAA+ superfamily ATPase
MVSRSFSYPKDNSFFLFGPRGTGKSFFIRHQFEKSTYIDLLEDQTFQRLLANPSRLIEYIPENQPTWVVIDEIQKIPELLDEVHRLIEERSLKFVLTGSSARKLKRSGTNLLAGRAFTQKAFPLSGLELGKDFDLKKALNVGLLPKAYLEKESKGYLSSYVTTYIKEEVLQEGLTRNAGAFARFLETASFSQGQILNYSKISKESSVERKTVTNYFEILEDILLSHTLSVFSLRAKRDLISQRKFYFFDVGVFRQIRPRGPLDIESEVLGAAAETLVLQELLARNEYESLEYKIHFWHTAKHIEVDFVLYGPRGLKAIEVKAGATVTSKDLAGLKEFKKDYPKAELILVYAGSQIQKRGDITFVPIDKFIMETNQFI